MTLRTGIGRSIKTLRAAGLSRLAAYLAAVFVLLVIDTFQFVGQSAIDLRVPTLQLETLPYTIFFSILIAAGLYSSSFGHGRAFAGVYRVATCVTAALVMSTLVLVTFVAWTDFSGREPYLPKPVMKFFDAHPPFDPFSIGFWMLISPAALVALIVIAGLTYGRARERTVLTERLSTAILTTAAGCLAFLGGSMMAASRYSTSIIDPGDIAIRAMPALLLGSLTAWTLVKLGAPTRPLRPRRKPSDAVDLEKLLASASQLSVVVLVLLYLGISQSAGYASRLSELIEARQAFASDVLHEFVPDDTKLNVSEYDKNGVLVKSSTLVPSVSWATVSIVKYSGDKGRYRVEVSEVFGKVEVDSWSARAYRLTGYIGHRTQNIADRNGIRFDASEGAVKLYPRISAQLRSKEVAFPGTGLSLDLASFTFLVPFVVYATLVVLGFRAKTAYDNYYPPKSQWILLDARSGLVGVLGWLWLGAMAFAPWLLSIYVVQAVALNLTARGTTGSRALELVATAYIVLVLLMLMTATISATKTLIALRSKARVRPTKPQ